jgi:hypothetical protein
MFLTSVLVLVDVLVDLTPYSMRWPWTTISRWSAALAQASATASAAKTGAAPQSKAAASGYEYNRSIFSPLN